MKSFRQHSLENYIYSCKTKARCRQGQSKQWLICVRKWARILLPPVPLPGDWRIGLAALLSLPSPREYLGCVREQLLLMQRREEEGPSTSWYSANVPHACLSYPSWRQMQQEASSLTACSEGSSSPGMLILFPFIPSWCRWPVFTLATAKNSWTCFSVNGAKIWPNPACSRWVHSCRKRMSIPSKTQSYRQPLWDKTGTTCLG